MLVRLAVVGVLAVFPALLFGAIREAVDYVFPDPNTADGSPDPAVWSQSGTIVPRPIAGQGLLIADPDNAASLLYFHVSTELANPQNVATFRALVKTPPIPDASTAWDNDHVGWRLILDDGIRHAELLLGRDPTTKARQIQLLNAPSATPIPFPWDNNFYNLYEIGRLGNGDVVVTATNNDPASVNPPSTTTYAASLLPASGGTAFFAWGSGESGGGSTLWQEVHAQVASTEIDIGLDTKELKIELGPYAGDNEIDWKGELTVPPGVTLDPVAEGLSIRLVSAGAPVFDTTIGPGMFRQQGQAGFRFRSARSASPDLDVKLKSLGGSRWEFNIDADDLLLTVADRTQVTATLEIGNKVGTETLPLTDKGKRLEFKKP